MPEKIKVTNMPETTTINDSDLLMIVQGDEIKVSKKIQYSTIKSDLKGIITEALEASY